ncbi:DUF6384 family protein [Rhodopirellula sallentina]|nr:DUF6384 family protein [Rhodopirellula sallentina]
MNKSAQAQAPPPLSTSELKQKRATTKLPGEEMTIAETLRVMDVAREMREQRETAEEMFRHDEVRIRLREKLMRTAALSGDRVTEAEIDAAIDQYLSNLHTYESPKPGFKKFLAYCWIWRYRIATAAVAAGAAGAWFLL